MIASVCLGFFGAILALVGMKCTKIGGSETTKARLTVLSGFHFIINGKKKPLCLYVWIYWGCSIWNVLLVQLNHIISSFCFGICCTNRVISLRRPLLSDCMLHIRSQDHN